MADAERLWKTCSDALCEQVSESTWKTFFSGVRPLAFTGDRLVLAVPNLLVKERLEGRYLSLVEDTLAGVAGGGVSVELEVHTDPRDAFQPDDDEPELAGGSSNGPVPALTTILPLRDSGGGSLPISTKYTFDTFVIGASNRFAHAAALSVAETPAKSYNPLFIHGEAGLGKTHLLQAIGHYVREHYSDKTVRYVSTETFMNEFIDAIRTNTTPAFKRRYRECDVLLVDDIQFLENKEGTQEEFFHTFNTIYGAGGQIVITSDRHAKSLITLEDRLRSRFLSGLITDVQPPDLETRLAILRKKADIESVILPDDVLDFIAVNIKNNIRELEGALVRLSAFASLNDEPATRALAERVLADSVTSDEPRPITPQLILEATAETFGFTVEELCGTSRRRPLVTARQIGMYVFRELTDFSYPAIARQFGGRDHTTVIHAVEKISSQMKERRTIFNQVTELMHRIKKGA
ncbi:MAG TPA: chromosomal replication initiator protein DnaA [Acidimicrobiales bacterium]|nr:chromosomal replication initiator protein DnaA [Acidimicrobiales bacterium]